MFNWLKKNAASVNVKPEPEISAIQGRDSISHFAISESEVFKDQGNAHINNGNLAAAAESFRQAIACNPNYAEAYTNLGLVFQMQGNPGEAIALFRKAVAIKPTLLPTHLNLGFALMSLGQSDAAEESLRHVITLMPEHTAPLQHAAALQALGVIAAQRGDFPDAENLLRHALKLNPDYVDAHINLGNLLQQVKRLYEAEASYRRVLEMQPNYPNAHYNLGILLVEAKRLREAEASFRRALELKPDYVDAHNNLGSLLQQDNRLPEAEASYSRALELNPDYVDAHNNLADLFLQTNRLPEAEAAYRRVLELKPDYVDAHFNLGNLLMEANRLSDAESSYRRALEMKPDYASVHNNLGNLLIKSKRLPEAEVCYRRALELQPDFASAHHNLGSLLMGVKRLHEAEESFRRVLELQPDFAGAYNNLGVLLVDANRLPEAEAFYRRALELQPDYVDTHNNLGILLMKDRRLTEAEISYRRVLALKPNFAGAHNNLGILLVEAKCLTEAEASYRRSLELQPDYVDAHNNLGNLLLEVKRLPEAEASYRRALEQQPDYASAHYNLGNLLQQAKRFFDAEASYRRAIELKPDYAEAYNNLGGILRDFGKIDEAVAIFRRAIQIKPNYADAHCNLIFALDLASNVDMSELLGVRKDWDETCAAPLWQEPFHTNAPLPSRRLRVGYVSADFKQHSAARVFGGMLTQYDRSLFDVFAYSNYKGNGDNFTELFRSNVTVWRNIVDLPDDEVAKLIREDRIDILVDLSGFTAGNRLLVFARKPAPIQITAWGYATGTGMRAMDAFFTDPVMVPPQEKLYFTEEVRYLPSVVGSFFTEKLPDVNELPALSSGYVFTFGSFNRLPKVSEETYRAWAEVLLAMPQSRLILKAPELTDPAARETVIGHFSKASVASDRVIMQGRTSWYEHMQAYNQIDLALDPFPHGGGVTALEGLMMGVPVVTLRWPTTAGRLSASIMTTLGLPDWIAETEEQYVELAIEKATDLQSLAVLRQRLRSIFTTSVIGDQAAYASAVEREYRQLWLEWCTKFSPETKPNFF